MTTTGDGADATAAVPAVPATPEPAEPGPSEPADRPVRREKPRGSRTTRDMLLSLSVTGAFVLALVVLVWRPTPDPVRAVDWQAAAAAAQPQVEWRLLVPDPLPDGWRATSARLDPVGNDGAAEWFIGVVTADGRFVSVSQTDARRIALAELVKSRTVDGTPAVPSPVSLDGRSWERRENPARGETSLVSIGSPTSVVVSGTVDRTTLEAFAASLRPR